MLINFELEGYRFKALNGGSRFEANLSVSFFVTCETTGVVDTLWKKLSKNGHILMPLDHYPWSEKYGFVQDLYGVTRQVGLGGLEQS